MHTLFSNRQNDEFSCLYLNIRSLVRNFDVFNNFLSSFPVKPDIIALAETKLTETVNLDANVDIPGYCFVHRKSKTHFGGVGFYISNRIDFETRNDFDLTDKDCDCESLFVEINAKSKKKQVIGVFYRHPRQNYNSFMREYEKLLKNLNDKRMNFKIFGDFNIDYLRVSNSKTVEKFTDMVYSNGAFMPIKNPTRVPIHTEKCCVGKTNKNNKKSKKCNLGKGSIIDHLYLSDLNLIKNIGINVNDMTDHYPIFAIFKMCVNRFNTVEPSMRRDYRNFDKKIFSEDITKEFDAITTNETNLNRKFECLHEAIHKAIDKNAPKRNFYKKELNSGYKPWFNKALTDKINLRKHLYFLIQKKNKKELINQYETVKKTVQKDLIQAEKAYYDEAFRRHKYDMKETWNLINKVINRRKNKIINIKKMRCPNGSITTDQDEICNILNNHFVLNGPKLARKIPDTNVLPTRYLSNNIVRNSLFLSPTDPIEIEKIIDNLKSGKASGPDGISTTFIKHGKEEIAFILTNLINECLSNGFFPDCLKQALVVPIHKKDDKACPDNYRPISLLPCISKIFEKIIYKRFLDFCKEQKILSDQQFGFRKKHSTQHALSTLTNFLAKKLDDSETSIVVFLDLSKAFETVDHSILLDKLYFYGIRGIALELIKSYLENRKQRVKTGNHLSDFMEILCGVPQGSILGPLLFLLYINDLPFAIDLASILFADDTSVLSSSKNISTLFEDINSKLEELNTWFISNKLTVNYSKTNYIIFSGHHNRIFHNFNVKMGGQVLQRVTNAKYLGLQFDEKLNWKPHVSYLCKKISTCCNIMFKLRHLVPLESCLSVYYSLFYSRVSYGIISWGSASADVVNPIRVQQNRILRTMLFKPMETRIQSLFYELKLLSIKDLFSYEIAKHVHKFTSDSLPQCFKEQFSYISNDRATRSSSRSDLVVLRTKKEVGKKSSTFIGANVWNSIPLEIRTLGFQRFTHSLKEMYIESYNVSN